MLNKLSFILIAVVVTFVGCVGMKISGGTGMAGDAAIQGAVHAIYMSDSGEVLGATFDIKRQTVKVILPNGKESMLPLSSSASGARYSDGKEIFWEHQGKVSYWIDGDIIFQGKIKETEGNLN